MICGADGSAWIGVAPTPERRQKRQHPRSVSGGAATESGRQRNQLTNPQQASALLESHCRLCEEIDGRVKAFLDRPIEGDWPYLWIDATYVKVRQAGRIVSVAVIVAVGVNRDGRREVLGLEIGRPKPRPSGRPSSGSSPGAACARWIHAN